MQHEMYLNYFILLILLTQHFGQCFLLLLLVVSSERFKDKNNFFSREFRGEVKISDSLYFTYQLQAQW